MSGLDNILEEKQVVVCIGSGGVGKTTISSIIALEGAKKGKKTLALTVDPSKRLAQSLGISAASESGKISKRRLQNAGYGGSGELTVRVLDVKKTFDELIRKVAGSSEESERILENDYYKSVADSIAGAHEYMAMETLLSAYEEGDYDLIVVDTPPSEHLSAFLRAPLRMNAILDSAGFKSFFLMDKLSFGFTRVFTSMSLKFIQKIVGVDVLHDMWRFFSDFEAVSEGIKERAERTYDLLGSDDTSFILVTNLKEPTLANTLDLREELHSDGYSAEAIVVNRTVAERYPSAVGNPVRAKLPGGKQLKDKLISNYENYKKVIDAEAGILEELTSDYKCYAVPELSTEVKGLKDLYGLRKYLFG